MGDVDHEEQEVDSVGDRSIFDLIDPLLAGEDAAAGHYEAHCFECPAQHVSFLFGEWDAGDPCGVAQERGGKCEYGLLLGRKKPPIWEIRRLDVEVAARFKWLSDTQILLADSAEAELLKAAALNALYSTNVYALLALTRHILALEVDVDLDRGDLTVVKRLADFTAQGKRRYIYSFATKYCSWHRPAVYPIYDSVVAQMLVKFRHGAAAP